MSNGRGRHPRREEGDNAEAAKEGESRTKQASNNTVAVDVASVEPEVALDEDHHQAQQQQHKDSNNSSVEALVVSAAPVVSATPVTKTGLFYFIFGPLQFRQNAIFNKQKKFIAYFKLKN
jgi:hypothetical protein